MPRSGPRRYRKYSRVFNVVIHPAAARAIRTFGGRPLSAFIRDRLGRSGPIRARDPPLPGDPRVPACARIARSERGVAGLGSADRNARTRLHPLTPMAAAALIGEPGLGRTVSEAYEDGTGPLAIGQRLFYLEVRRQRGHPGRDRKRYGERRRRRTVTATQAPAPRPPRRGAPAAGGDRADAGPERSRARSRATRTAVVDPAARDRDGDDLHERGRRPGDRAPGSGNASPRCQPRRPAPDLRPGDRDRSSARVAARPDQSDPRHDGRGRWTDRVRRWADGRRRIVAAARVRSAAGADDRHPTTARSLRRRAWRRGFGWRRRPPTRSAVACWSHWIAPGPRRGAGSKPGRVHPGGGRPGRRRDARAAPPSAWHCGPSSRTWPPRPRPPAGPARSRSRSRRAQPGA